MEDHKPRWMYRFDNFQKAYVLLREGIELVSEKEISQLEKEGIIHRFEFTVELAWKTMMDYLEFQNLVLPQITPRAVVKESFAAKLISDGTTWMSVLDARNKMSHTYDFKKFEQVIEDIAESYLPVIEELYFELQKQIINDVDSGD